MRKHKFLSICASVLLSLSVLTTGVLADTAESTASENSTASDTSTSETDTTTNTVVAQSSEMGFPCDKLTDPNSASIYMVSLDTDTVVYTYNPDERRPMASMTKIMTYIVTAETVSDLQNTRTTVPESVAEELEGTGSSLAEIQTGESFTIYELLNLMMVPSGNDAALTLAKYVDSLNITADDPQYDEDGDGKMSCVELMNKKAAELGCTNTHFVNPHGLHDENHYTTAREMATITEYALTMPYFTDVTSQTYYTQPPTNMTSEERTVTTTNRMLLSYDDEYYTYATGVKTGSLNESGYCISATATYDGYSYLVVCMGSPYIDSEGNHIDYHGEMYDAASQTYYLNGKQRSSEEMIDYMKGLTRRGGPQIRVGQRPPAGAGAGQSHRNTAEQSGKRRHHHKARSARKRESAHQKGRLRRYRHVLL